MRIAHNISAINTYRNNIANSNNVNKKLEKLSSGYKINKAADDAAGLNISEKMRAQIRGLEQAKQNIQHGISLIQTAESGLAEIENPLLIRLRELAVKAANDTLTDNDRALIQMEVNQIKHGINDIANNTEFNEINLLNKEQIVVTNPGSGSGTGISNDFLSLNVDQNGKMNLRTNEGYPSTSDDDNQVLIFGNGSTSHPAVLFNNTAYPLESFPNKNTVQIADGFKTVYSNDTINIEITQTVKLVEDKYEINYSIKNNNSSEEEVGFYFHMDVMLSDDDSAPFIVDNYELSQEEAYTGTNLPDKINVYNNNGREIQVEAIIDGDNILETPSELRIGRYSDISDPINWTDSNRPVGDSGYALLWEERTVSANDSFELNTFYGISVPPTSEEPVEGITEELPEVILQVGPNEGMHYRIELTDARTEALGIENLDLTTQQSANNAITIIDNAIQSVSDDRIKFGSYQNTLEYIQNNVSNYKINLTTTESKIRDLDIAKEAGELAKHQILLQSSQSLTAQVNQMSQSVLEILK